MSTRKRMALFILGLLVLFFACLALAYAFWPLTSQSLHSTLPPTLFTPP